MIHTISCPHDFFKIPPDLQEEVRAAFYEWVDKWYPVATDSRAGADIVAGLAFRYDDGSEE